MFKKIAFLTAAVVGFSFAGHEKGHDHDKKDEAVKTDAAKDAAKPADAAKDAAKPAEEAKK